MAKKHLLLFLFLFLSICSYAQDMTNYKSRMQLKAGYGINAPMSKLLRGEVTDNLLTYDDHSVYYQFSCTYFLPKNLGIELAFQTNRSKNIKENTTNFLSSMQSAYGVNYFITATNTYDFYGKIDELATTQRGYLGLVYRFESKRFFVYPKLSLGITSFYTKSVELYLKERGYNKINKVTYITAPSYTDYFTLAPSATFGYKLSKRFYLNLDVFTTYFNAKFNYTKTVTDLSSGESILEEQHYNYKKHVFAMGFGFGIIMVTNYYKNR